MRIFSPVILYIILSMTVMAGCATTPKVADSTHGSITITAAPEDADIIVDGKSIGKVSDYGSERKQLKLGPGTHKVEIKSDGYYSYSRDVTVGTGTTEDINVNLNKK